MAVPDSSKRLFAALLAVPTLLLLTGIVTYNPTSEELAEEQQRKAQKLRAASPRMMMPEAGGWRVNLRGDLRLRPRSSSIMLAASGLGGATLGVVVGGPSGLLLGAAAAFQLASLGDEILAAAQRRRRARQAREEVLLAVELHVQSQTDAECTPAENMDEEVARLRRILDFRGGHASRPMPSLVGRRACLAGGGGAALALLAPGTPAHAKQLDFVTTPTGLRYADITVGTGDLAVDGDSRVTLHVKGRLVGKQGWIFVDSALEDEPYRLTMGSGALIEGLDEGLRGMRAGGTRRLVVPSSLGYVDRAHEPIPRSFGQRQRLYGTVLNENRKAQESIGLGEGNDVAGVVALDISVLVVRPPKV